VELITLREESSRKLLEEHKVTVPEIIVTADPAFSLPPPDFDAARAKLSALGISPSQFICIALRAWRHNPPGLEQHIARFADYAALKYNYTVLFVPMRLDEDTVISKKTMALMKQPAVFLEASADRDIVRGIAGLSAFTLAMRLHTLIYAISQGVPVIGLVYDPKVQGLMDSIGQPFYTAVEETDADTLIGFADKIVSEHETVSAQVKAAGQAARALAERNAELCMGLLGERMVITSP
jgi:polysaccharide pyruvyl transferase WcaK-like protein